MRVLGPITLTDTLIDWGLHEALGRQGQQLTTEIRQLLSSPNFPVTSLKILLNSRWPLIAPILAAYPESCSRVECLPKDQGVLRVLGRPSVSLIDLVSDRKNTFAQDDTWIRKLEADQGDIAGPFLGVARSLDGPFTLFDGVHRAVAWLRHAEKGRNYPITLNLILTRQSVSEWE